MFIEASYNIYTMSQKNDEVVYLNNCELIIESITFKSRGTFYLVWKKGKKSTQSNKFQINTDQPINPKQLLTLSLKVYQQSNVPIPRHTHLILFNGAGEEIDRTKVMIHEWTGQFKQNTIQIGGASIKIKFKRRGIMKLQKFHRLRSQVEETSEDEAGRFLKKASGKGGENERDEILRLTKELQDQGFLFEKLKEERNNSLIKIQRLQSQLGKVQDRMRKDIAKLKDYYSIKMEKRESIYKEQIQHLITSFNKNYELNYALLEGLIKEKYDYEHEIEELKESNQQYISHQQANFERIITEMENHKKLVDEELHDSNEKLKEKQKTITQLNDELDQLNSDIQKLKEQYKQLSQAKVQQYERLTKEIEEKNIKIIQYEDIMAADKLTIKNNNEQAERRENELLHLTKVYEQALTEKTEMDKINSHLIIEKERLQAEQENLIAQNTLLKHEKEDQTEYYKTLAKNYEDSVQQLVKEHQASNTAFAKELQEFRNENLLLHAKNEQSLAVAELNRAHFQESLEREKNKDMEIEMYKRELQSEKLMYEHLMKENNESLDHFKALQNEYNEKMGQYINRNTQLQIQNTQMRGELKELSMKSAEDLERIKDQYDRMLESNRKLYEDQLELLKTQRDQDTQMLEQTKNDYEKEIQDLMEHQKNEYDDLEKLYKEEMENKTKEYVQLLQKNSKITEQFQDFKMKIELAKINEDNSRPKKKGKMPTKKWNTQKIAEEDEDLQDEPIETVEVQSQEEEQQPLFLKKKSKSAKKPKVEPVVIESEQQESQGEQKGQSIVQLYKKKNTRKSKLKKGKKISNISSIDDEDQQPQDKIIEQQSIGKSKQQSIKILENSEEASKSASKSAASFEKLQILSEEQQEVKPKLKKKVSKKSGQTSLRVHFDEEQVKELKAEKEELTNKINQLQEELSNTKKSEKNEKKLREKLEKEQKKHLGRIKSLEEEIEALNKQIQDLNSNFNAKDEKLQQNLKKQAEQRKKDTQAKRKQSQKLQNEEIIMQIDSPPKLPSQKSAKKQRKEPIQYQRQKSDHQQRKKTPPRQTHQKSPPKNDFNERKLLNKIEELEQTVSQKQRKIERLEAKIKQLNKQLEKNISEGIGRQNLLESNYIETERRETRQYPQINSVDPSMKASIVNLEEKVSLQREKYHEMKLRLQSKNREFESVETELRKAKQRIQQLQEKIKKQSVPRSVQQMQGEIDDLNRKILELSRNINQSRLQRDSFEDEIRIIKKKMGETNKISQQWQGKALQAEREIDDLKRKQQKLKRQMEQWKDQQKRLKQNNRKSQDQLMEVRKNQSEFVMQRKKVLDEVVRLESLLAQRETEMLKLNKELQKMRGKMSEDIQGRTGKERQLRTQFEKLEIERSKSQRKNRQLEETIKLLKEKLEAAEKEAKKSIEERKQTYGEKLRKYIEEIMTVKKVVQEYQQENSHLKIQNSQFFEQNEILKMSYEKLEIKYQQLAEHEGKQQQQIKGLKDKLTGLEQTLKKKAIQEEKANTLISTIRKELDNERVASRKKTQKLQTYEEINERYLYEIKNLKVRLNDYESNVEDVNKISEEFYASQRTIDSLQEQLHKVSEEYQQHSTKYVYTREDVEAAIRELKQHEDRVKEQEMSRIVQELDQNHAANRQNMENQLLLLYSQNEKLRVSLQKATEDAVQFQHQLNELDTLRQKCKFLEKEKNTLERRVTELNDELKTLREQCRRLEVKFNESIRNQQGKSTENVVLQQKFDDLNRRYRQLNENYNELKVDDKRLLEKYKIASDEKDASIEKLHSQIQGLNNKLLANELEIRRLKELQKFTSDDSFKKIKKLEQKIEELNQYHQQSSKQSQIKYRNQIKEMKTTITKYQEELSDKLHRIQELNEGVLMLQSQVEEITAELTNARAQISEDGEVYTMQINKLRNNMRDMQQAYDANLRNLQQELSAMGKELTALKFSREANNSRLKMSRQSQGGDDKSNRRLEEKIKLKDRRIEELKETILVLQEKLNERLNTSSKGVQIQSYKIKIIQIQKESKELLQKKDADLAKINEQLKRNREELFRLRSKEEELTLLLEEKDFQIQSISSELSMISRLYNELQRQVQKRKENLNVQIKEQSILKIELQTKKREIDEKNEQIVQFQNKIKDFETNLKKKTSENKVLAKQLDQLQREKNELLSVQRKKLQGQSLAKLKFKQAEKELEATKTQNRKLRNEINLVLKEADTLKSQLIQKNVALSQLLKEIQSNDQKITDSQQIISKYIALNERCLEQLKVSLEDVVSFCLELKQNLAMKEEDFERISEEHEELKFMYERKYLDLQQVKKENCELILKSEEREISYQQLSAMHERMVWFEQQNKELAFREEAIKVQLQSIYSQLGDNGQQGQIRRKISDILQDRYYI